MPYAEPYLSIMAKLETQLVKDSSHNISWSALNLYRNQSSKNVEVRLSLLSTIHKPERVFVALQNLKRNTSQNHSTMIFDDMSVESVNVEINSV